MDRFLNRNLLILGTSGMNNAQVIHKRGPSLSGPHSVERRFTWPQHLRIFLADGHATYGADHEYRPIKQRGNLPNELFVGETARQKFTEHQIPKRAVPMRVMISSIWQQAALSSESITNTAYGTKVKNFEYRFSGPRNAFTSIIPSYSVYARYGAFPAHSSSITHESLRKQSFALVLQPVSNTPALHNESNVAVRTVPQIHSLEKHERINKCIDGDQTDHLSQIYAWSRMVSALIQ